MRVKMTMTGLVFLVSFAILIGSSYNTYLAIERFYNPDSDTYLHIAKGDFKDQSLIRKYRVIVPALAFVISQPISKVYYKIVSDHRDKFDWPLLTGFFLVNSILMSLTAVVLFLIMQHQGISLAGTVIGLLAFLAGGRWAGYETGHPVTDSLTLLSICLIVYGLMKPHIAWLITGIIAGLLSKESTALFFPMILIFSGPQRWRALAAMAFSFLLYFGLKYGIDRLSGSDYNASIHESADTFNSIGFSLSKLFSVKGMADVFSVYGFFSLFFITALFYRSARLALWNYTDRLFIVFLFTILVHMLLSTELARMWYLGSALFVPYLAKCFDVHPLFKSLNTKISNSSGRYLKAK